jgi:hypothetical protein
VISDQSALTEFEQVEPWPGENPALKNPGPALNGIADNFQDSNLTSQDRDKGLLSKAAARGPARPPGVRLRAA